MLFYIENLPKLLYFLRTSTCFNPPAPLEKNDKNVRDRLSKVCNVNFDAISSTQLALPAEMGRLGVSSASFLVGAFSLKEKSPTLTVSSFFCFFFQLTISL